MSFESYHQSTIEIHLDPGYWKAQCVTCDWQCVVWAWIDAVNGATEHWRSGRRD